MSDFAELSTETEPDFFPGYAGRRLKAAFALSLLWSGTVFLHLVTWGEWAVLSITALMGVHAVRVGLARSRPLPQPLPSHFAHPVSAAEAQAWPYLSLLVAAKNEEAVIAKLVESLLRLDYPPQRYDLWVVDDHSTDRTPEILKQLAQQYPRLQVIRRGPDAIGGKSGALNQVWPRTKGSLLAVFDADAQVPTDLLRQLVPMFTENVGAVQARKAIVNPEINFWTQGQVAEMALDAYFQEHRTAIGGIGELRGNGQFVRREALIQCGGWNEETITDDLDLSIQLHLNRWDIELLFAPAVGEEGVVRTRSLWHQRNRWAEGGFQRYLDYWRPLARNGLGWQKSIDMVGFWLIQYLLPAVAIPDLALSIVRHRLPIFSPLTSLAVSMSCWGMFTTLRRTQKMPVPLAVLYTVRGTLYMFHWLVVIATTTVRISVRPKRLKWVKTVHGGDGRG